MVWLALALLVLAAAAAVVVVRRRAADGPAPDWSVQARRLLTPSEQVVYDRLRAAFPQHVVLAQVSFERLLGLRRSHGSPAVFQRYTRLVADVVICSRELMPLIVVELKNAPHGSSLRTRAEASKAAVLAAAGLVYVTVDVASQPEAAALRAMIRASLPRRAAAPSQGAQTPQPARASTAGAQSPQPPRAPAPADATPAPVAARRIQRPSLPGAPPTSAPAAPARPSRVA